MNATVQASQTPNLSERNERRFREITRENRELRQENSGLKQRIASLEEELKAQARARESEQRETEEQFARQSDAFRRNYPDYDLVLSESFVPEYLLPEIVRFDNGPAVAYLLGKNPGICQELADLRPHAAVKKVREISRFIQFKDWQREQAEPAPLVQPRRVGN